MRNRALTIYKTVLDIFNWNYSSDCVTPLECVREQIKNLPVRGTVCVPGAGIGTYVVALIERGFKPENIYAVELDEGYYELGSAMLERFGVKYLKADFLTWNPEMKFDVVVGNPPYQRPKHAEGNKDNRPLWLDFLKRGGELLKDGGHLSMLVPSQVAKSTRWNERGKGFAALAWGNIVSVKTGMEKWFNVGTGISQVTVTTGDQDLINVDGTLVDIHERPWLPRNTSPEAFSVLDKISGQPNSFEFKLGLNKLDEDRSFGFWRLNQYPEFRPLMTCDRDKSITNRMWIGMNAADRDEAESLIKLMGTKLFTAFRQLTFYEPNFAHLLLSGLTYPDSIPETDEEVFSAYGLTKKEIEFVNTF